MVDWPGLLQWSLKHSDGTRASEVRPMDEATKKWLTEAFEHYTYDEGKILKELAEVLARPEAGDNVDELADKTSAIDRLEQVIENMEASRTLVKVGGLEPLVKTMLGSSYSDLRLRSTRIFSSSVQNNPKVQKAALDLGTLDGLMLAVNMEPVTELREAYVTALSALVRGELVETRQAFISNHGLKFLSDYLASPISLRAHRKMLLLLSNLLYHESESPLPGFTNSFEETQLRELLQRDYEDAEVQELVRQCQRFI